MPLPFLIAGAVTLGATLATGAATSAAAGAAGAAAAWHHRRWLQYHRRKGLEPPAGAYKLAQVESRDGAALLWWSLRGAWQDGWWRPEEVTGAPVVCIHGYTQNGTNFWGIRHALAAQGRASVAVSLRHRLAPMSWYTQRLTRSLERALDPVVEPVHVVAHSMGGVLLRLVLSERPDLAGQVRSVVTLGTPHQGTAAARGIPLLPEVQALKRGAELLRDLPPLTSLVPRVTSIAGSLDTLVYPMASALEPGAQHVVLPVGHAGLLTHPAAVNAVLASVTGGFHES